MLPYIKSFWLKAPAIYVRCWNKRSVMEAIL